MASVKRDDNTVPALLVEESTTGNDLPVTGAELTNSSPVHVAIVDSDGTQISSFGGGTQYTEGDTDATITGTAMLMEGAGNALVVAQGTATDGLLVNLGTNNDVTVTGSVTANAGTNLNTSSLALESGGNLATLAGTDFMLGTDFSNVFGAASIVSATPAVKVEEQGTVTVDLGANNDVTVTSGNITADTELPAAAALDDSTSNPTAPAVGSFGMIWTGSAWVRMRQIWSDSDDISGVNLLATAGLNYFHDGANWDRWDGTLKANSGVDIGDVDVTSISAGSNLIGDVGIQGRTTGGLSTYYDADLDETAVAVKAAAGTIYAIEAFNTTAAPLFLQLFNVAQGSVTVGTTTPTNQWVIPGNADSDGAGFTMNVPQGIAYGTAITAACSTDSEGNSAPGAGACIVNIHYK